MAAKVFEAPATKKKRLALHHNSMWEQSHRWAGVHASVAGCDRPSCVPCLESVQVCLSIMRAQGPGGHALFACMGVPWWAPLCLLRCPAALWSFCWGGDAMMPGASVVGTAYSRLPRVYSIPDAAPCSCVLVCYLCGLTDSCFGLWWG